MTSTPAKLKTLQGIFDPPKIVYRRDFVRENKLNLRELQKLTTKNKLQQPQAQSSRQPRQQQSNYGSQQRTVSQQRAPSTTRSRTSLMGDGNNTRSIHAQKSASNSGLNIKTTTSDVRCPSCGKDSFDNIRQLAGDELCNKGIQTEDINDEDFLYGALKKCTSSEQARAEKSADINVNIEVKGNGSVQERHDEVDNISLYSRRSYPAQHDQISNGFPNENEQDNRSIISKAAYQPSYAAQDSPRSNYSLKGATKNLLEDQNNSDTEAIGDGLVQDRFERMSLKSKHTAVGENTDDEITELYRRPQPEADQLSLNSHHTQVSHRSRASQHSKVGSHKLGSRENLNLPRYLEREKRDKAEAYLREMARDPKCPFGHILLSEEQRTSELKHAENNFNRLISELNHMPMTSETLRSRMRKQEIEKELTIWENKIRVFSKSSVYVPQESFHQAQQQQ